MVRLSRIHSPRTVTFPLIILSLLLVLCLALVPACNDDPSGVQSGDTDNSGNINVDPGTTGEFLIASVDAGDHTFGRIEVWGTNLTSNPDSGTVSFDAILVNATGSPVYPPVKFVVTSITPRDVTVLNPSGYDGAGDPYFDFSDRLGSDGMLAPGERSRPFTFVFRTGTPRSFVIGYRFDFSWTPGGRMIVGAVFNDLNNNGMRERSEPGIPGIAVVLDSRSPDGAWLPVKVFTGENGGFRFDGLDEGIYRITAAVPPGWVATTSNPVLVTLTGDQENLLGVIFGMFNPQAPPPEYTLFGPIYVGPGSDTGRELETSFPVPVDSLADTLATNVADYALEVAYPPIMAPFPAAYDSARVVINGEIVYDYVNTGDPTFRDPIPGVFILPEGLLHAGDNTIYIRVDGGEYALLQFRVFAMLALRENS